MFSFLSKDATITLFFLSLLFLGLLFVCIRVVLLDRVLRREEKKRRLEAIEEKKRELAEKKFEDKYVPPRYVIPKADLNLLKSHAVILNKFSIKIYNEFKSFNDPNLFISPYAISLGLALNLLDPECSNEAEVIKLLGFDQQSKKKVLDSFDEYLCYTGSFYIRKIDLNCFSSLFINMHHNRLSENAEFKCMTDFLSLKAGLDIIDFKSPDSSSIINNRISKLTKGKIKNSINSLSIDEEKVLINCGYFNAQWTFKFDPRSTQSKKFFLNDHGDKIDSLFMIDNNYYQSQIHPCGLRVKTCRLNYKSNQVAMTIILPDELVNLDEIENNLTYELVQFILNDSNLRIRALNLELPRFGISRVYTNVNEYLDKMKLEDSVYLKNDNTKSVTNVDKFLHETFLEVGENGTERINSYVDRNFRKKAHKIKENISDFICNKPFIYIIHETRFNGILFMGKLTNPLIE